MISYDLVDLDDGSIKLIRTESSLVAVIMDRALADVMIAALRAQDECVVEDDIFPHADDAGADPSDADFLFEDIGDCGCADPAEALPIDDQSDPAEAKAEPAGESAPVGAVVETPLQEAFRRLEAGESLGAVADDLGIPMPKLRGNWAKRVRDRKAALAAAGARQECRGCGREFMATLESDGMCARCTRDVGA